MTSLPIPIRELKELQDVNTRNQLFEVIFLRLAQRLIKFLLELFCFASLF